MSYAHLFVTFEHNYTGFRSRSRLVPRHTCQASRALSPAPDACHGLVSSTPIRHESTLSACWCLPAVTATARSVLRAETSTSQLYLSSASTAGPADVQLPTPVVFAARGASSSLPVSLNYQLSFVVSCLPQHAKQGMRPSWRAQDWGWQERRFSQEDGAHVSRRMSSRLL